ncbi:MAG TPA: glycoside hydrolase family 3 N-terminal domain-containing protein [Candidatus Saccharimonadales bacterium]|nr:glycoside hydrolase family 3 N-terminal domain-containing protein [Candidatus Saccharimonadales bacterium]
MLAFEGEVLPARIERRLVEAPAAGFTLFRHLNVRSPGQVRELTEAFQRAGSTWAVPADLPMLVAADQEGGQFLALGDGPTAFAGNMALGAVDDERLTEAVARAAGTEARAMGVNVVYAPCLDLATNPANPALGIRSFGDDPAAVGRHGAAFVRGLQGAGVAATVKHAPGMGHISNDTHHGLAVVDAPRDVLDAREFVPFRAAFAADAGARLAMSGHLSLPAVTGRDDLPATLSRAAMTDLLRRDLGFDGVTISDALDMSALAQGPSQVLDIVAAVRAGIDLLLAAADPDALHRIEDALRRAVDRELLDPAEVAATDRRVAALRGWLAAAGPAPDLSVVGGDAHRALAAELAARSMTLVADPAGVVARPFLGSDGPRGSHGRILTIMPRPADLTPADTSSLVAAALATALRRYHPDVEEIVTEQSPDDATIAAIRERAADSDVAGVVIGTIDAHRQVAQQRVVEAIAAVSVDRPVVAVALRGPWDVATYPPGVTAVATYSILPGSLDALADALAGRADFPGRLPVRIDGLPAAPR